MADGVIAFDTAVNRKGLMQDLAKVRKQLDNFKYDLKKYEAMKLHIEIELDENVKAQKAAARKISEIKQQIQDTVAENSQYKAGNDGADSEALLQKRASLEQSLKTQTELYNQIGKEIEQCDKKMQSLDKKIQEVNVNSKVAKERAADITAEIEKTGEQAEKSAKPFERFSARIGGLAKRVFVFSMITAGLREMRNMMGNAIKSSSEASAAIGSLKGALFTLAAPIVNVAVPAFVALINVLAEVVRAVAGVVAVLFGSSYEAASKQAEALNNMAAGYNAAGGAAKDAKREIMGFDQINKFDDSDSGGGGGGSSGIGAKFDDLNGGLLSGILKFNIQDVLFKWDNLTGEDWAAKIITGLTAIAGGVLGFAVGGVPGAIIGVIAGATLGLVLSSLLMDADGKLSKNEIAGLVGTALLVLAGGVVGFVIGGVPGAALGILISAGMIVAIKSMQLSQSEAFDKTEFGQRLNGIVNDLAESDAALTDIRVRIASLTGEVDEKTMTDFNLAKKLIDEIFFMDGKENKTAEEIQIIQEKINTLNGLNLDGLQGMFQTTTDGYIIPQREAVDDVMNALLRQYQIEAMRDQYIEAYRVQTDAEILLTDAKNNLEEATNAANDAEKKHAEMLTALEEEYGVVWQTLDELTPEQREYTAEIAKQKTAMDKANEVLGEAKIQYAEAEKAVAEATETVDFFTGKLSEMAETTSSQVDPALENGKKTMEGYSQGIRSGGETAARETATSLANITASTQKELGIFGDKSTVYEEIGDSTMSGLTQGIKENADAPEDAMLEAMENMDEASRDYNDIHSPSGRYKDQGELCMDGLAVGIEENGPTAVNALVSVLGTMQGKVSTFVSNTRSSISGLLRDLSSAQSSASFAQKASQIATNVPVPRLAQGAVIPPNREFMAILGDQKRGTNIEAPLDTIKQAVAEVTGSNAMLEAMRQQNELLRAILAKSGVYLDGRKISQTVTMYQEEAARANR